MCVVNCYSMSAEWQAAAAATCLFELRFVEAMWKSCVDVGAPFTLYYSSIRYFPWKQWFNSVFFSLFWASTADCRGRGCAGSKQNSSPIYRCRAAGCAAPRAVCIKKTAVFVNLYAWKSFTGFFFLFYCDGRISFCGMGLFKFRATAVYHHSNDIILHLDQSVFFFFLWKSLSSGLRRPKKPSDFLKWKLNLS